jgi:hypothetical protein
MKSTARLQLVKEVPFNFSIKLGKIQYAILKRNFKINLSLAKFTSLISHLLKVTVLRLHINFGIAKSVQSLKENK